MMPDLTSHNAWACESTRSWKTWVKSSDGTTSYEVSWGRNYHPKRTMEYGWHCTCPGFKHHRSCKHVREYEARDLSENKSLIEDRCGWDSRFEEAGEPVHLEGDSYACPVCCSPAYTYTYGA